MFKVNDNASRANRNMYERVEPVLTSLNAGDGVADTNSRAAPGSEPTWIRDRLSDALEINKVPSIDSGGSLSTEPRNGAEYRALDWLSAIALLMASVAIALALIPHPF